MTTLAGRDDAAEFAALRARVRELEAHAQVLEALLAASPTAIMLVKDRVVVHCNAQCEALLGYSTGELNGKSTRIYMPSDEQWQALGRDPYFEIVERGSTQYEALIVRKNSEQFWCLIRGVAVDRMDASRGWVFALVDVTERRGHENGCESRSWSSAP